MARTSIIPFGPQHAAFLEPVHLRLELSEEKVVGAEIHIGYNHRGMEYALSIDYKKSQYICERVCGICSFHHSTCYCRSVEGVFKADIPERARYIRTVMMECQRLTSHLLALSHIAETAGFENLFMQCFRAREKVMRLVNQISGNRIHYSMNIIGGVKRDITIELEKVISSTMEDLTIDLTELKGVFAHDRTLYRRTSGIGILSHQDAIEWAVVGPVARASGIGQDIRSDGDDAYGLIHWGAPVVREEGDCYARMMVRMEECFRSVDIIMQCISDMKAGPTSIQIRGHPSGENISRVEAPRGELIYYVKAKGSLTLDRVKMRTPAFMNIACLSSIVPGCQLADVPVITISVDPCICCTDR